MGRMGDDPFGPLFIAVFFKRRSTVRILALDVNPNDGKNVPNI